MPIKNKKNIIAAFVFLLMALMISTVAPSIQAAWVVAILLLTIYLFAFEIVDVDVAAISILVVLGLTSLFAPLMGLEKGLVDSEHLFQGFSSNAVISIIAVMIIGAGLDRTGLMTKVAAFILQVGGTSEKRVIPIISGTVGIISSFMQNVGAAALFLPVVSRISARTGLPLSRLLMPMGFCAILGGTVTMIGSSPLILLNDLIATSNKSLPLDQQMHTWGLFDVTPIGLALIATGIVYFMIAGRFVLPVTKSDNTSGEDTTGYFKEVYNMDDSLAEVLVPGGSAIIGLTLDEMEMQHRVRVIAMQKPGHGIYVGPGVISRDLIIEENSVLGILASPQNLKPFLAQHHLIHHKDPDMLSEALSPSKAGMAELVIPPGSKLIGKSPRDIWMRKVYGFAVVALHRLGRTYRKGEGIRDMALQAGDTLVGHITWDALSRLEKNRDFVVVTSEYPKEDPRPHKVWWALMFFGIALSMILFTELQLSVALLTGAMGMVLSGVLNINEAYEAVSWKTVFLLASLIPLGVAVESSGTAEWIAQQTLTLLGDLPIWMLQASLAVLATFFTLVMSNVGATVLLVPLAVNIAIGAGVDPALFALTVAIATSNSFLIPTHQVNALIMGPGGYRVVDFMRAGGIMTILFLIVSLSMLNLVF